MGTVLDGFQTKPLLRRPVLLLGRRILPRKSNRIPQPLRWDEVRLNLPGSETFDSTLPRVMKWDLLIDNIAGDVLTFVDDSRASGCNEEVAWSIARQFASRLQYLGIQDAPRKRQVARGWKRTGFESNLEGQGRFYQELGSTLVSGRTRGACST